MRLVLAATLLLSSTALAAAQGLPGQEYQTFQCKVFNSGCKPPQPVVTPAADDVEEPAAPPPTKVAKVKRRAKPKKKVAKPAEMPAAPAAAQ